MSTDHTGRVARLNYPRSSSADLADRLRRFAELITKVPVTWAGVEVVRNHIELIYGPGCSGNINLALTWWAEARARIEIDDWILEATSIASCHAPPNLSQMLRLYNSRVGGTDSTGPCRIVFDEQKDTLAIEHETGAVPVRTNSDTLSPRVHVHEWTASAANRFTVEVIETSNGLVAEPRRNLDSFFVSHWNKAMSGVPRHLAALGIPRVARHAYPAAFMRDRYEIDAATRCILMVRTPSIPDRDSQFDTVAFFVDLFSKGELPLASENDVRKLVMAIAAPLLRHLLGGLLGTYWFTGAPGAGKDFLAELIADIYPRALTTTAKVKFDLSSTDDLEQKRSMFASEGALYARAKEIGKRPGLIDLIIRLAGTDRTAARGMRQDEVDVPVTFTILADSTEDAVNRRELRRRTTRIECVHVADDKSLGSLRRKVLDLAPRIVADILHRIEQKPPEWYVEQPDCGSRPVGQVALARLFGADLEEVTGRGLDELWEAMLEYRGQNVHGEGAKNQQRARGKDGEAAKTFPSFRFAHFVGTLKGRAEYSSLLSEMPSAKKVIEWIRRETDYDRDRKANGHLRVEVNDAPYALVLYRDNRMFILEPELVFLNKGMIPLGPVGDGAVPMAPFLNDGNADEETGS